MTEFCLRPRRTVRQQWLHSIGTQYGLIVREILHKAVVYLEFTELKIKVREENKSSISLNKSPPVHELCFLRRHFLVQPGFKCTSVLEYLSAALLTGLQEPTL